MKTIWITSIAIVFFCISAFAWHHGGCAPGNDAVVISEYGGGSFTACCVGVGEGQLSCTAGGCWFNYPEGPRQVGLVLPDCVTQ